MCDINVFRVPNTKPGGFGPPTGDLLNKNGNKGTFMALILSGSFGSVAGRVVYK